MNIRDLYLAIQAEVQTLQWWIRLGLMLVILVVFIVLGLLPRLYAAVAVTVLMVVLSQVGPLKSPRKK